MTGIGDEPRRHRIGGYLFSVRLVNFIGLRWSGFGVICGLLSFGCLGWAYSFKAYDLVWPCVAFLGLFAIDAVVTTIVDVASGGKGTHAYRERQAIQRAKRGRR